MWLDRFAGQHPGSTPSPPNGQSRAPSPVPLPRRTPSGRAPYLTSQRPGISPRGSSVSLVSSDSSSSLLGASKRTNGSALRQSSAVEGVPDPEEVLARILGPLPVSNAQGDDQPGRITEDDLDFDFDFGGLDLRQLAHGDASTAVVGSYRPRTGEDCRSPPSPRQRHLPVLMAPD